MKVDDLVVTRHDMDRGAETRWVEKASVGQSQDDGGGGWDLPQHLAAPLDAGEISSLLRARAMEGWRAGRETGASEAWQTAREAGAREVRVESTRWVDAALELVIREIGPVLSKAQAATAAASAGTAGRKTEREKAKASATLAAATEARDALEGLRDRLAGLQANVKRDGINP